MLFCGCVTTFAPAKHHTNTAKDAEHRRAAEVHHKPAYKGQNAPRCFAECHCMLIASNAYEVVISAAMATVCPHAITGYATAKIAKFTNTANIKNGK